LFAFAVTLISSFKGFLVLGLLRALFTPMEEGLIITSLFRTSDQHVRATTYSGFAIWGAIGWAAATAFAGIAVNILGIKAAMYFASLLFFAAMLVSLSIPEPKGIRRLPKTSNLAPAQPQLRMITSYFTPIRKLLINKRMLILLLAALPLSLAINAAGRYFPIYLGSSGASPILIGLVFTVPALLKVPIFLQAGKLSDKRGARRPLLIFSASIYTLLFLLIALISSPLLLFLIYSLLASFAWPPLITGSTTLISEIVSADKWVTGQTLYSIWMWSIGGTIGPLIGGFTSDAWGFPVMFVVVASLAGVSALTFRGIKEGGIIT
jgi:PPP family 3-phenylpropionic acid transporter